MDEARARLRDLLMMPDGRRFGQAMADFQRADFAALDSGRYRHAYLERPRGHSKTTDLAAEALVELLLGPEGGRLYAAAVDQAQAALLHDACVQWIRRTPEIQPFVEIQALTIRAPERGSTLTVLPADDASAWGLQPTWVAVDEFSEWRSTRAEGFWYALLSSLPKRGARMVIITTAGHDQTGLCYEHRAKLQQEPTWLFSRLGQCAPWIDPQDLAEQRRLLRPHVYQRVHENQWVADMGAFFTADEVEAVFDPILRPLATPVAGAYHALGLDVGVTHDRTAAVVAHRDHRTGHVYIDNIRTWTGTRDAPVDLMAVERAVWGLAVQFRAEVTYDPFQAVQMAQRLGQQNVRVREYRFSGGSRRELFGNVLQLVRDGHLHCFDHPDTRRELLDLEVTPTRSGERIDHRPGRHDDIITALGLACLSPLLYMDAGQHDFLRKAYGW
jgi:hypothetical protein